MSSAGALRTEGNEKFRSKQYFDAYRFYTAALEKCPQRDTNQMANIYICLSKTELILEKTEESIMSATKAIEIDPTNYRGYLSRANAYFETLSWQQAYEDLVKAQELEPTDRFIKQRVELARSNLPSDYEPTNSSSSPNTYLENDEPQVSVRTRDAHLTFADDAPYQTREVSIARPNQRNQKLDTYSNQRTDTYSNRRLDTYSNQRNDSYSNKRNDPYSSQRTDTYSNKRNDPYSSQRTDTYSNQRTDSYSNQRKDPYSSQRNDTYSSKRNDPYSNQRNDPYSSQRTDTYSNKRNDPYSSQRTDTYSSQSQRNNQDRGDPYYGTSRQNQRSYQDTLRPHSIPDPEPMSQTKLAESEPAPSGKYTSAYNIELMHNLMCSKRPPAAEVLSMIESVESILSKEPNIVKLNIKGTTFHIVGDTHGQYQDVLKLFDEQGYPSSKNPYLFNGDFVDRGSMGVEIVIALLAWKLYDPTCIYFNRGNHETRAMNSMYGFEKECTTKYDRNVYEAFAEFFNTLPIGHVINDAILVVHGGLSDQSMTIQKVNAANRFQQPPDQGLINDILWADPMDQPGLAPSPRGITKTFGPDVTQKVLNNNKLSYLIRSHQVQENGYLLQHNRKCITVFSAPNYIGSMYNKGAICDFTFDIDGTITNGPTFITYSAQPIPRNYPPMKFSPFGAMF